MLDLGSGNLVGELLLHGDGLLVEEFHRVYQILFSVFLLALHALHEKSIRELPVAY